MKTILDFESRSTVDLKKCGAYVYAAHPTTEILCCAVKRDGDPTVIWFPKLWALGYREINGFRIIDDAELLAIVEESEVLGAHNAQFERVMWREIMAARLDFPEQPASRWRCSAARAAALALPRHLEGVCAALHLPIQKDKEGHKLMLRMCKPDKKGKYLEDTASLLRLGAYCITDADAEYAVEQELPPLPESEERIWQLDQEINDRGVTIDLAGCAVLNRMVDKAKKDFGFEIDVLTDGAITSAGQRDKLLNWLEEDGVDMDDLKKGTVVEKLEGLPEGTARRLLEIRQTASLTSVAKLKAMEKLASADGRVRGSLLYYAATTGRWGGKGIQGQNLPRDSYKTEEEVDGVLAGTFDGCAIKAASRCIRGMITAGPGLILTASDYNAIEARILGWIANESHVLDTFRNNLDPYRVAAMAIYGVGYDDVTKSQRQVGKVAELALGYQGWIGALTTMADGYGVDVGDDEKKKSIIIPWRENRPGTTALWRGTEEAALKTVLTGKVHKYGKLMFGARASTCTCACRRADCWPTHIQRSKSARRPTARTKTP